MVRSTPRSACTVTSPERRRTSCRSFDADRALRPCVSAGAAGTAAAAKGFAARRGARALRPRAPAPSLARDHRARPRQPVAHLDVLAVGDADPHGRAGWGSPFCVRARRRGRAVPARARLPLRRRRGPVGLRRRPAGPRRRRAGRATGAAPTHRRRDRPPAPCRRPRPARPARSRGGAGRARAVPPGGAAAPRSPPGGSAGRRRGCAARRRALRTMTETVAVMPGMRRWPGLSTPMMAL